MTKTNKRALKDKLNAILNKFHEVLQEAFTKGEMDSLNKCQLLIASTLDHLDESFEEMSDDIHTACGTSVYLSPELGD